MKLSDETKVGALLLGTGALALLFAWFLGVQNPFKSSLEFYVTYNFAGGIEIGSPVRVSGIKVGKVVDIDFFVPKKGQVVAKQEPGSADFSAQEEVTPVRLKISVLKKAAVGIKTDSRFYINLAGIIGERYVEITPGGAEALPVKKGDTLAGVDPPRIDQLLSQSFDLAGKIVDLVERNKGDISKSIELLVKLSSNVNGLVVEVNKSNIFKTDISKLVENLVAITREVRVVTDKTSSPEGIKTLKLLHELLWRPEPLDQKAIKKFFQEEGLKTRIF